MKRIISSLILFLLIPMIACESSDYVYLDNKTLKRQLSNLRNGFVNTILQIDPNQKDTSKKFATAGKIIKEKNIENKNIASSELIELVLRIIDKGIKYSGKGWYPTYDIYIKYNDKKLFFTSEKYMPILFDFKNSIITIEGRAFVFNEQEAKLLQTKLDLLLNMPPQ